MIAVEVVHKVMISIPSTSKDFKTLSAYKGSVCIYSDLWPVHQSDQPVVHSEYSVSLPQSTPVGGAQAVHVMDEQLEASY